MAAVEVENLRKVYGELAAVDGLSFAIEQGEVVALLGPNGAGKTTTVEILEGHRRRASGEVRVLGFDPETGGRDYREPIGIVLAGRRVRRRLLGARAGPAPPRPLPPRGSTPARSSSWWVSRTSATPG